MPYCILILCLTLKANLQVQQTPNPEAQLPSLVPPFDEHSSLNQNNLISIRTIQGAFLLDELWFMSLMGK